MICGLAALEVARVGPESVFLVLTKRKADSGGLGGRDWCDSRSLDIQSMRIGMKSQGSSYLYCYVIHRFAQRFFLSFFPNILRALSFCQNWPARPVSL